MSFTHPRRTTKLTTAALTPSSANASGLSPSNTNMSLQKASTFHEHTTPESELPYRPQVPPLPRRSQSTLEDVVDAHKRRVAITLGDIDRGLSSTDDPLPTVRQAFRDDADPVPRGFLDHTVGPSIMDGLLSEEPLPMGRRVLRPRNNRRPARYADSGLGSSISSTKDSATCPTKLSTDHCPPASAITRSAATSASTLESLPRLSARATNRIHEHILKPILSRSSLKDFHPIVKDCPRRIHQKEIICLRDLEKTLMFMAPERTKSAKLYLDFCLTSIRCIQATVEYLSEREQTRPSDRPYSNGYFVDLVDQIKQYAQQVKAAKEREEKGEQVGEMDAESTDEVRLFGGLTKNGRPAELVRVKKNGKAISIATGMPIDLEEEAQMHFKRSLSEEADDDILRSMARRKRSASAAELAPKRCREPGCDKEFKRPCDLTKHEKTHSRPWKCDVESCKYHEYGWPTEKERDRHNNDKHSAAPPMYKCHFDCPYQSKRESNCKQHMEKAHGWQYVRSKNNGKNRDKASTGLPTPQTTNMQTPSSEGTNTHTPDEKMFDNMDTFDAGASLFTPAAQLDFPAYNPNPDLDFLGTDNLQLDYSPISELTLSTPSGQSPFLDHPMTGQEHFNENFQDFQVNGTGDFSLFGDNDDLYSANVHQLPTPSHEIFQRAYDTSGSPYTSEPMPQISPIGHGNTMLYTPNSLQEVHDFDDFYPTDSLGGNADFQLFPSSTAGTVTSSAPSALFGELPAPLNNQYPGSSAKELLDFYTAATTAAKNGTHAQFQLNTGVMDWTQDEGYSGYQ